MRQARAVASTCGNLLTYNSQIAPLLRITDCGTRRRELPSRKDNPAPGPGLLLLTARTPGIPGIALPSSDDGFEISQPRTVTSGGSASAVKCLDVCERDGRDEILGLPRARLFAVELGYLLERETLGTLFVSFS